LKSIFDPPRTPGNLFEIVADRLLARQLLDRAEDRLE